MAGDLTYTGEWLEARRAYVAATESFTQQARVLCLLFEGASQSSARDRVRIAAQLARESRARQTYLEAQSRIRALLPLAMRSC
jgi:hypothetical protein